MDSATGLKITGYGLVSAAGVGVENTCETLFSSSARPLLQGTYKLAIQESWSEELKLCGDFLPNLFAWLAADEALQMAGLSLKDLVNLRVGICVGSTVGCTNYQEEFARKYNQGEYPDPEPLLGYFTNNTAQFLAHRLSAFGPVMMISNACTSGADALGIGSSWLRSNLCDLVICGGTEVILERIFLGFRSLMVASSSACRPFDRQRDGLVLGEGAGILVLEKPDSPRSAKGYMLGYGSGSDSYHPTAPHPEARGLELAAQLALRQAGISREQIDFINAHATGTPANDLTEGRWYRSRFPGARVSATKGYTGHTLAAAGAIEAIFCLLSLKHGKLPRSLGFAEMDPEIGMRPITAPEQGEYQVALSPSLGFGGTNAVLVLGRA